MQFEEENTKFFLFITLNATSTPIHEKFDYKAKFLLGFLFFILLT